MLIKTKEGWEIPESEATPESVYLNRRAVLKGMGFAGAAGALSPSLLLGANAGFPTVLNPEYALSDLTPTKEKIVKTYNNFYEFSLQKNKVHQLIDKFRHAPWTLEVGGLVRNPQKFDIDSLVKKVGIEQRIYRFRCVEAWSMVVPWDGFPIRKLMEIVKPTGKAKYLKFTTFYRPAEAPEQKRAFSSISFPYVEGLTIQEAAADLTMLVTGLYGKSLPAQNGAPVRLMVPWKYGFKSIKSIVKIEFTEFQPRNTWNIAAAGEYGFYANVNPAVSHPRWSQAKERVVDGSWFPKKQNTLLFNGYANQVAGLYKGLDLTKNF